jgi:hypothetical protein
MTAGVEDAVGIPVRDENDEIEATIALIKLAIAVTARPVYLLQPQVSSTSCASVVGYYSRHRLLTYLFCEFTTYSRDGTVWKSKDNPVTE